MGNEDNSLEANLQADCFAGLYASTGFLQNRGEDQPMVLSPGDLDEAVIAFLLMSPSADEVVESDTTVGTAFQRFDDRSEEHTTDLQSLMRTPYDAFSLNKKIQ